METLADRVKRLREARGLSRADVASKMGVSAQSVASIEVGDTKQPGFVVGVKLARALGVSAEELAFGSTVVVLGRSEDARPSSPQSEERLARAEAAVSQIPDMKRQLAKQGEQLAELLARLPPVEAARPTAKARRARGSQDQGVGG